MDAEDDPRNDAIDELLDHHRHCARVDVDPEFATVEQGAVAPQRGPHAADGLDYGVKPAHTDEAVVEAREGGSLRILAGRRRAHREGALRKPLRKVRFDRHHDVFRHRRPQETVTDAQCDVPDLLPPHVLEALPPEFLVDDSPQRRTLDKKLVGVGRQAKGSGNRMPGSLEGGERNRFAPDPGAVPISDLVEAGNQLHESMWSSITCWKRVTTM